jgi:hypothetical protein
MTQYSTDTAIVEVFWFHPLSNQVFCGFTYEKLTKQI